MSFHLYRLEPSRSGRWLQPVTDLRPTGAQGPIARFVTAHAHCETPFGWFLSDEDIISLTFNALNPVEHRIVIRLGGEAGHGPLFQRLVGIRGQSEMMDSDAVLVTRPLAAPVTVPLAGLPGLSEEANPGVDTMEAVGLSGGTIGGRFFWRRPRMNIGAAVRPARRPAAPALARAV